MLEINRLDNKQQNLKIPQKLLKSKCILHPKLIASMPIRQVPNDRLIPDKTILKIPLFRQQKLKTIQIAIQPHRESNSIIMKASVLI